MPTIDDYVARIEGTCGAEKDVIVVLKFDKKDEAIAKILQESQVKNHDCRHDFRFDFSRRLFPPLHKRKNYF